jgi:hypothetical protein
VIDADGISKSNFAAIKTCFYESRDQEAACVLTSWAYLLSDKQVRIMAGWFDPGYDRDAHVTVLRSMIVDRLLTQHYAMKKKGEKDGEERI